MESDDPAVTLLLHLTVANFKMTLRNRQALFWALAFPLAFVVFFALIGSFGGDSDITILAIDESDGDISRRLLSELNAMDGFSVSPRADAAAARAEIESGDAAYLLAIPRGFAASGASGPLTLTRADGGGSAAEAAVELRLAALAMERAGVSPEFALDVESVESEGYDFRAFVLPGVALWGIMSNSVIGLAVALANYREKKILRRIKASPMRARTFFAAQIAASLGLSLIQAALILGLGSLTMGVDVRGALPSVAVIILASNVVFLNLGFIVGAYSKTAAAASGLGNLVVVPMAMLSGVFFPLDALPAALAAAMRFLPLSPMVEALRGATLSANDITDYPLQMALIAAWTALTALAAVKTFKFE